MVATGFKRKCVVVSPMSEKDRQSDGTFSAEVSDEDLLEAVRTHEPAATSEVAGEVGMTRQGVDRRLRKLREENRVENKKIGASLVWFAPNTKGSAGQ